MLCSKVKTTTGVRAESTGVTVTVLVRGRVLTACLGSTAIMPEAAPWEAVR